tara:strand:+ start:1123 stop:1437 length:315 start_codon:yes stop_codon:yes gene_type:complete
MNRKIRNNALRMKKSLQKTLLRTNEVVEKIKETQKQQRKLKEQQEKKLLEQKRRKTFLESLEKMSYNNLRKLASEAGVSIYQRKKEEIKQDLKEYYERLWSKTH